MSKTPKRSAPLQLKNLLKVYQSTKTPQVTKDLLLGLFPILKERVRLKDYDNVVYTDGSKGYKKYSIVDKDNKIIKTCKISNSNSLSYNYIHIKHIPYEFLDKLNYFKLEEE